MYVNNDYGQALNNVFVENFTGAGGEVLSEVAFEQQQSSYTSELSNALNSSN
jgi:ABC-type branched-subunit amino acid transport system substrate-binding protein